MGRENRDLIAGFVSAAVALLMFGWLAHSVWRHETIVFDAAVRDGLHSFASPGLTRFFRFITTFGSEMFLVPFGAFVVWRLAAAGRSHAAVLFAVAAVGAEALDFILKLLFRRARPEVFFGYTLPSSYSFPSGHSMLSACFFGVLAALLAARLMPVWQKAALWIAAAIGTLLIGCSRIYLGVHYPSDVIAGYAAAVIWVLSVRAGYQVWLRRYKATVARGSGDSPGTSGRGRSLRETPGAPIPRDSAP
jgi:undecaprenyl-diphosphatase